jgi:predicted nucleotidyltransferase
MYVARDVEAKLGEIVRRIVDGFHPERIILFGSRARGDAAPDSDADLLVVMRVRGSRRRQAARLDAALAGVGLPKDIIVVTPAEFDRQKHVVGGIVHPAVQEGRVLYDVAGWGRAVSGCARAAQGAPAWASPELTSSCGPGLPDDCLARPWHVRAAPRGATSTAGRTTPSS